MKYLDHGFVELLSVYGSDKEIEDAARISYSGGDPNRKVSETRALLRYLMNHDHTSPFEMGEVKFHLRIPIFVMRQLVRHRTASLNEYSGRYSEMTEDCYVPAVDRIQKQSTSNKQGSGEPFDEESQRYIRETVEDAQKISTSYYNTLIGSGFAKELARCVLPVSNYTELYWKCDLNNFFRFLRLRLDHHAQSEIRSLASLMYDAAKPHFPICFEAFDDYVLHAKRFSFHEMNLIRSCLDGDLLRVKLSMEEKMTKREKDEFLSKLDG